MSNEDTARLKTGEDLWKLFVDVGQMFDYVAEMQDVSRLARLIRREKLEGIFGLKLLNCFGIKFDANRLIAMDGNQRKKVAGAAAVIKENPAAIEVGNYPIEPVRMCIAFEIPGSVHFHQCGGIGHCRAD